MEKTLPVKALPSPLSSPAARPTFFNRQMLWVVVFIGLLAWALLESGIFRQEVINPGGFTLALQFLAASLQPELGAEFIRLTLQATLTTLAFAVIGIFIALYDYLDRRKPIAIFIMLLSVIVLLLTFSKSSIVAAFVAIFVAIMIFYRTTVLRKMAIFISLLFFYQGT